MFKLPFSVMPGSWGLSGKTRKIAKAEYELSGQDLDIKIAAIECEINSINYKKRLINIDLKYNVINEYEAYCELVDVEHEPGTTIHALAMVPVDLKFLKITKIESEKRIATLKKEPWVTALDSQYNKTMGKDGFSFELDWNDYFIAMLIDSGYEGAEPDHIIEQWFDDVANSQLSKIIDDDDDTTVKKEGKKYLVPRTKTESKIFTDTGGIEKKKFS